MRGEAADRTAIDTLIERSSRSAFKELQLDTNCDGPERSAVRHEGYISAGHSAVGY